LHSFIFGITIADIFRYFEGYISGLIGRDIAPEWNHCMNGIDFFLKHLNDIKSAVLHGELSRVFNLVMEMATQGFSKVG